MGTQSWSAILRIASSPLFRSPGMAVATRNLLVGTWGSTSSIPGGRMTGTTEASSLIPRPKIFSTND